MTTQTDESQPLLSAAQRQAIEDEIVEQLKRVIDPETGVDVIRMRLVPHIEVDETGTARYTFRPSSPICPLAVSLAMALKQTVASVAGITGQQIQVEGYLQAEALTHMINAWEPSEGNKGDETHRA
jgi:metal-sulfur cluster biosynthetic enzyme